MSGRAISTCPTTTGKRVFTRSGIKFSPPHIEQESNHDNYPNRVGIAPPAGRHRRSVCAGGREDLLRVRVRRERVSLSLLQVDRRKLQQGDHVLHRSEQRTV